MWSVCKDQEKGHEVLRAERKASLSTTELDELALTGLQWDKAKLRRVSYELA